MHVSFTKQIGFFLIVLSFLLPVGFISQAHAATPSAIVSVSPSHVIQGEPVLISVRSPGSDSSVPLSAIKSGTVAGSKLYLFLYNGVPTALYGTDINQNVGTTTVRITLANGIVTLTTFYIGPRIRPDVYLPIPAKLGGNSVSNQVKFTSILSKENTELAQIKSRTDKALWNTAGVASAHSSTFIFPIAASSTAPIVITNDYGYNRQSGAETITHKGVDFRAASGTPVYAINRGVVKMSKRMTVYGNTIVVDHGLGLLSMYMHLSRRAVPLGTLVQKGQLIGYSGDTGYSEGDHLHLTIRIGGISIDPIKLYSLFGVQVPS